MRAQGSSDFYLEWAAAYVLGALDADERREFENHIIRCRTCAATVREFAAVPALLSTLPDDEALTLGQGCILHSSRALLSTIADKIRRRRQRPSG